MAPKPLGKAVENRLAGPRKKVAILGGGIAALSAAFELTSQPGWKDAYEISVYQTGWRLGGKGASGRNPDMSDRIEEHGLHIWMGFYANAIGMMRKCYEELARPQGSPLARWSDAFKPHHFIVAEEQVDGRWIHWPYDAPRSSALARLPAPWDYVRMMLDSMRSFFHRSTLFAALAPRKDAVPPDEAVTPARQTASVLQKHNIALPDSEPGYLDAAADLARAVPQSPALQLVQDHYAITWLLRRFIAWLWSKLAERVEQSDEARRLWIMLDLGYANVAGVLADGVLFDGFDAIDDRDYQAWLRQHGASEITIRSALIRGLYDFVFAMVHGDPARPSFAAGAALRLILRTAYGYDEAIMWKMQAGMGDAVFAPLYEVLRKRGVQFHFFHRVKNLGLSPDKQAIATIRIGRQVTLKQPEYEPLVTVKGLLCWPNRPLYDQIQRGEELREQGINLESSWTTWQDAEELTLRSGQDFDLVVLGISLGALPHVCPELIAASARWRSMIAHVQTIATQSLQLWMIPDLAHLGWNLRSPVVTAYEEPLETWADMTQTLPRENWPSNEQPGSIAYFCGPLDDPEPIPPFSEHDFPDREARRVRRTAAEWLRRATGHLWPAATSAAKPAALDWSLLFDRSGKAGEARLNQQFWRANVEPSDRYVISAAGSTRHRLKPDQSGFGHLYLAGDWTRNGLNVGCVEAAVMSGRQAARAISGALQTIPGESDL